MKVNVNEMQERCEKVFLNLGLSQEDAEIITDVLLNTEMRGVFTHGFFRVPNYVRCVKSGGIKTNCELTVVADTPSWALVDGNDGLGIVIAYKAMQLAMKKAKGNGIGVVNVRGSHHFGAAGYYTGMCAKENMIGMSMSNGDILVAATGSKVKTIGNNPFSFATPAGKYDKIIYDIAMSHTSDQKVIKMAKEGKMIPDGWLIDKNGIPTNDPSEYEKGGTLMPFGGYKGYGFAMMVEVLAAVLSGAAVTKNVHAWNTDSKNGGNVGHLFIAMDISKICDNETFIENIENMIDGIKNSEKAIGADEIYFPGEIENKKYIKAMHDGFIEIDDETMANFADVEKSLQ